MTPDREAKHVLRTIRKIPIDCVASKVDQEESDKTGLWCVVAGEV